MLEGQLTRQAAVGSNFVILDRFTIADSANYCWLTLAPRAELSFAKYPLLEAYIARIQAMPAVVTAEAKLLASYA